MKKIVVYIITLLFLTTANAQYPPAAGQDGSTAILFDGGTFIGWASECTFTRGWKNDYDHSLGLASIGDANSALGIATYNGVLSLGDGGSAVLKFEYPIVNGPGFDFAVFENAFSDDFLELATVEVSSDGINYVKFCANSLTPYTAQVDTFGTLLATNINNLAGKYRTPYGTPFDLEELLGTSVDVNNINFIKITDVVGSISPDFGTYDCDGNLINDPFPTPFESAGFDLDAIGVIHNTDPNPVPYTGIFDMDLASTSIKLFGNNLEINETMPFSIMIYDIQGRMIYKEHDTQHLQYKLPITGTYMLFIEQNNLITTKKIIAGF